MLETDWPSLLSRSPSFKKVFITHDKTVQRKCMIQFCIEVNYISLLHIVKNGKQICTKTMKIMVKNRKIVACITTDSFETSSTDMFLCAFDVRPPPPRITVVVVGFVLIN
jgi:hypothetical protein